MALGPLAYLAAALVPLAWLTQPNAFSLGAPGVPYSGSPRLIDVMNTYNKARAEILRKLRGCLRKVAHHLS